MVADFGSVGLNLGVINMLDDLHGSAEYLNGYPEDMDPYLRRLLLYCYSADQPNDYPVSDSALTKEYQIKVDVRTYNLVSAMARDCGKDFSTIFTEALDCFGNVLVRFGGNHFKETRHFLK